LSQSSSDLVDFDEVIRGVLRMLEDALGLHARDVKTDVGGHTGELPASIATPMSLVLTELVQNAAEHAFADSSGGTIRVQVERRDSTLRADVSDDGVGIGPEFEWEAARRSPRAIELGLHDLGQVRRLAGDVLFMVRGRVCEQASAGDFFESPSSPEAEAFIRGDLVL
jgi:chemotaxis protein histidine kinase CheA